MGTRDLEGPSDAIEKVRKLMRRPMAGMGTVLTMFTTRSGDDYKKLVLKDEVIVGMVLAGKIERAGILLDLMRRKVKTTAFKSMLLGDDFGLVCVPENMRLEMSAGGEACTT